MVMHTKLPLLYGVVLGLISGFSKIYFYFPSYSRTIPELLGYVPRGLKMCSGTNVQPHFEQKSDNVFFYFPERIAVSGFPVRRFSGA